MWELLVILVGSMTGGLVGSLLAAKRKSEWCEACLYGQYPLAKVRESKPVSAEDLLMLHGAEGFPPQGRGKA